MPGVTGAPAPAHNERLETSCQTLAMDETRARWADRNRRPQSPAEASVAGVLPFAKTTEKVGGRVS
jgi:hypothetical protein